MSKKYLDDSGLLYFWQQIKTKFATKAFDKVKVGTTTIEADGTSDTLELVAGTNITLTPDATNDAVTVATSAEVNQNAFSNVAVGSSTIEADAKTDTLTLAAGSGVTLSADTSTDTVTISATGTQNQDAFSYVKVGSDTIAADTETDTLELAAGSNVTLTADTTNDKVTIAATDTTYSGTAPITVSGTTITHDASGATAGTYGSTSGQTPAFGANASVPYVTVDAKGHVTAAGTANVTIPSTAASADGAGLMSSSDFSKLAGIESGAQVNTVTGVKGDSESSYRTGNVNITPANIGAVATSAVGSASGVCPLNSSGTVDTQYLPSYVDDVIEAYPRSGQTELTATWLSLTNGGSALTPETGKIYIILAASTSYAVNTCFRWSGSTYVELADGNISSITNAEIDTILAA